MSDGASLDQMEFNHWTGSLLLDGVHFLFFLRFFFSRSDLPRRVEYAEIVTLDMGRGNSRGQQIW